MVRKPGLFSRSLKTRAFRYASSGLIVAQFWDVLDKSLILHENCPFCAHSIAHFMKTGNFCFHSCPLTELIYFLPIISQNPGPIWTTVSSDHLEPLLYVTNMVRVSEHNKKPERLLHYLQRSLGHVNLRGVSPP